MAAPEIRPAGGWNCPVDDRGGVFKTGREMYQKRRRFFRILNVRRYRNDQ